MITKKLLSAYDMAASSQKNGITRPQIGRKEFTMSKLFKLFAITMLVVGLSSGLALADSNQGDDVAAAGAIVGSSSVQKEILPDGQLQFTVTTNSLNGVASFECVSNFSAICVQVADLQGFGDAWGATISRTNGSDPDKTSNQVATGPNRGAVFNVGRLSPRRCSSTTRAIIHASAANEVPAGLPAQFRVRIQSQAGDFLGCNAFTN